MKQSENLTIWNQVCTTDPDATKRVNQRGGFTAIDAYSQIMKATEVFGPVGKGWGWKILSLSDHGNTLVMRVWFWYGTEETGFEVVGQKSIKSGQKEDEDCAKKALTDAITKALSYLGFNADVFLGKFDDSKYVEGLKEQKKTHIKQELRDLMSKIAGRAENGNAETPEDVESLMVMYSGTIDGAKTRADLRDWLHGTEDSLGLYRLADKRKAELAQKPNHPGLTDSTQSHSQEREPA